MDPYTFMAIASALMSAQASKSAGKAAMREAAIRQRQFDAQLKEGQLSSLMQHNQRVAALQSFINTNESILGTSGRDFDKSFNAIRLKAEKEMALETDRAYVQHLAEQGQISLASKLTMEKARNIKRAKDYEALSTIISGGMKASKTMGSTTAPMTRGGSSGGANT